MAYTIDAIRLPLTMAQNADWGPRWKTTIHTGDNAVQTPLQLWSQAQHVGQFSYDQMELADLMVIKNFQMGRNGAARGFLWYDVIDNTMVRQTIGIGDGTTDKFPLKRIYADAVNQYSRIITRPIRSAYAEAGIVADTLRVWVNGVIEAGWTFSPTVGIDFIVAPAAAAVIEAECRFDTPVRFSEDYLGFRIIWVGSIGVPAFSIEEIKEYI